jgi:hypothetical protein
MPFAKKIVRGRLTYAYDDGPVNDEPIFRQPLVAQFISTLDSPYLARTRSVWSSWSDVGENGIRIARFLKSDTQQYSTVRDGSHRVRLSVRKNIDSEPYPVLYYEGKDSLGSYRVACEVYANFPFTNEADTASAVFDPSAPLEERGYGNDANQGSYTVHPLGTFYVRSLECSDRTEIVGSDGWRMISYGPYEGSRVSPDAWFAPMHPKRYCYSAGDPVDFTLIDPKGNVRYVYDRGDFYVVEYK